MHEPSRVPIREELYASQLHNGGNNDLAAETHLPATLSTQQSTWKTNCLGTPQDVGCKFRLQTIEAAPHAWRDGKQRRDIKKGRLNSKGHLLT